MFNHGEILKGAYRLRTDNTPILIDVSLPLNINQTDYIDWKMLAQQHGAAFQKGLVTRERLCSILELRSIMGICPKMTINSLEELPKQEILHFYIHKKAEILCLGGYHQAITQGRMLLYRSKYPNRNNG